MQRGGMDCDTIMEEHETENGSENARSESDAAATRKEAADVLTGGRMVASAA